MNFDSFAEFTLYFLYLSYKITSNRYVFPPIIPAQRNEFPCKIHSVHIIKIKDNK